MFKQIATVFTVFFFVSNALAAEQELVKVNKSFFSGTAIEGYDPVAYFESKAPVKGSDMFKYKWSGATWLFRSEENRRKFISNPLSFAPQYGGFCAYAVSQGSTAGIDPNSWSVVNDKLYLNYNSNIKKKWIMNQDKYIQEADAVWSKWSS